MVTGWAEDLTKVADDDGANTPLSGHLLRLWHANSRGPQVWHASLGDTYTGERWGFAGIEQLTTLLAEQMGTGSAESGEPLDRHQVPDGSSAGTVGFDTQGEGHHER